MRELLTVLAAFLGLCLLTALFIVATLIVGALTIDYLQA